MERRRVDIGDATLDAVVGGAGPITVVFENGLGTPLEEWDTVAAAIARRARVLCYDRRRAPPKGRLSARTAVDMASDLSRLLRALRLEPPYVVVGHSWGGVVARVFAHRHSSDVAGLVFVDATHEAIESRSLALLPAMYFLMGLFTRTALGRRWLLRQLCPAGSSPAYRTRMEMQLEDPARRAAGNRTVRAEGAGIRPSLTGLRGECPTLPRIPIHVLTAGGVSGPNVKSVRRVHDAWRAAVAETPHARYTNVPTGGHFMSIEAADVVVDAILGVLDDVHARAGQGETGVPAPLGIRES